MSHSTVLAALFAVSCLNRLQQLCIAQHCLQGSQEWRGLAQLVTPDAVRICLATGPGQLQTAAVCSVCFKAAAYT